MSVSRSILGKVLILHKRGVRLKINSKMQKFLDEIVDKEKQSEIKIDFNTAKNIIFPEFFEWEGCVLLRQDRDDILPSQFSPNQFIPDRTAFEADYNHVHLNDFFSENFSPFQVFILATKIIEVWAATLYKQFNPNKRFILILSFDDEEAVLRFYTVRENESPWLDTSSIESYLDGLMVIEV
jgi:hypothetical protein